MNRWVISALCVALCALSTPAVAGPYADGAHHWNNAEGKLTLMSGLLSDNAVQMNLKYTFYFEAAGKKPLYQVPLVDGKNQSKYALTVTEATLGDVTLEDASIVQNGNAIWLLVAERETEPGDEFSGAVTTKTYKLISGNDGNWAYYFQLVKTIRHAGTQGYTVEKALKENANALR